MIVRVYFLPSCIMYFTSHHIEYGNFISTNIDLYEKKYGVYIYIYRKNLSQAYWSM